MASQPHTHSRPSGKGCGAGIKADVLTAPGNCLTPTEAVLSLSSWMNIRRDDGKLEGRRRVGLDHGLDGLVSKVLNHFVGEN